MAENKKHKILINVFRIILGVVFVFSGIVKCIDPWGTALKIEEYFLAFGMEWMAPLGNSMAVIQCVLEFVLGAMLLFRIRLKLSSFVTMLFMIFFTALTLVIAIWNPVDDCGCFGSALIISNWMTFAKNAVLLPMSIAVWRSVRNDKFFAFTANEALWSVVFIVAATGIYIYSWRNLPPIDTFVYKKGTDLRSEVLCSGCANRSVVLVYEDMDTGEHREFRLTDTEWYDTDKWKYVATKDIYDDLSEEAKEYDFALYDGNDNLAEDILYFEGTTYLIMIHSMDKVSRACAERIKEFISRLDETVNAYVVVGVSEEDLVKRYPLSGSYDIDVLTMDRRLMTRVLRTNAGIVVVNDGVVADKRSCVKIDKAYKRD